MQCRKAWNVGWMSGQDTTSQDPFSTTRCSRKKEETKQKKNNQNTWISHKRARLHGACKLHYEKKILQEETSPSTLVHPILSHMKFPSQKLSLSWRPPEPLKSLATAVQEPPAPSLTARPLPSLFSGPYGLRTARKPKNHLSVSFSGLLKA